MALQTAVVFKNDNQVNEYLGFFFFGHGDIVALWNRGERTLQSMTESEIPRIDFPPYRIQYNIIHKNITPPPINAYISHDWITSLSLCAIGNPPPPNRVELPTVTVLPEISIGFSHVPERAKNTTNGFWWKYPYDI